MIKGEGVSQKKVKTIDIRERMKCPKSVIILGQIFDLHFFIVS